MRVLVADKFESSGRKGLQDAGCEVIYEPDLNGDALAEAVAKTQADVLVVRSTKDACRSSCARARALTRSTSRPLRSAASGSRTARARTQSPSPSSRWA